MVVQNSSPFGVGLYTKVVLFPNGNSHLRTNPFDSSSSRMDLCFFKFNPQKLKRVVWFNSLCSTSFIIMSFTIYILSRYDDCEPDNLPLPLLLYVYIAMAIYKDRLTMFFKPKTDVRINGNIKKTKSLEVPLEISRSVPCFDLCLVEFFRTWFSFKMLLRSPIFYF
jgi:hypothetical protein